MDLTEWDAALLTARRLLARANVAVFAIDLKEIVTPLVGRPLGRHLVPDLQELLHSVGHGLKLPSQESSAPHSVVAS